MKTIYLVTRGEYDGYCVVAVFSKRESAERFARAIKDEWSDTNVEEYILYPIKMGEDERFYDIFFDQDLDITSVEEATLYDTRDLCRVWEHVRGSGYTVSGVPARDKGEATKKATDILLDYINKER